MFAYLHNTIGQLLLLRDITHDPLHQIWSYFTLQELQMQHKGLIAKPVQLLIHDAVRDIRRVNITKVSSAVFLNLHNSTSLRDIYIAPNECVVQNYWLMEPNFFPWRRPVHCTLMTALFLSLSMSLYHSLSLSRSLCPDRASERERERERDRKSEREPQRAKVRERERLLGSDKKRESKHSLCLCLSLCLSICLSLFRSRMVPRSVPLNY